MRVVSALKDGVVEYGVYFKTEEQKHLDLPSC